MAGPRRIRHKVFLYIALAAAAPVVVVAVTRSSAEFAGRLIARRYPPPGRMIPVGDYRLQLYCTGIGSPTVIVEPGMGLDWVGWRFVIGGLTPFQRVCVYDRAGYGWSDRGPKPRTALREAEELHALLSNARVAGPYILAAHSFGGYIARIYASRYRASLAGVVLVEPSHEDEPEEQAASKPDPCHVCRVLNWIPPLGIQRLKRLKGGYRSLPLDLRSVARCYQARYLVASSLTQLGLERNEFDSLALSKAQVRQAAFPSDLPLRVVTAVYSATPAGSTNPRELPYIHRELQLRLAQSSRFGRQVIAARSGHMVPLDEPQLIVDQIRDLSR